MIHNIITAISAKANQYIKNKLSIDEDVVIVKSLIDIKGNLNQGIENKISVFLLSIEEEKLAKNSSTLKSISNPSINININIMFASYFTDSNYIESLRYVSLILDFSASFIRSSLISLSNDCLVISTFRSPRLN